jgi:hypothetical protein
MAGEAEAGAGAAPTDEQLARLIVRVLAGAIALILAGGVAVGAQRLADGDRSRDGVGVVAPGEGGGLGDGAALGGPGTIGPLAGAAIATYLPARADALARVRERRAAVVSFERYLSPADARKLLAGLDVSRLLVAFPGGHAVEAAPDADVAALSAKVRKEATDERKALQQLLPTVEDPDFAAQYKADITRLDRLASATPPVAVVFAAAVIAPADALRRLSTSPGVRLVDVGPSASPPNPNAAWALRPEETAKAGDPPTRPI